MKRPPVWDRAAMLAAGRAILAARSSGVPWKVLERLYDRDRSNLFRAARAAQRADATSFRADATSSPLRRAG